MQSGAFCALGRSGVDGRRMTTNDISPSLLKSIGRFGATCLCLVTNMSQNFEHFISASTGSLLQLTDNAQHPYFSYAGKRPLDQCKQVQL